MWKTGIAFELLLVKPVCAVQHFCNSAAKELIYEISTSVSLSALQDLFVPAKINQHLALFPRSLYALYDEDVTVKGIPGYRFSPPNKVFANMSVNPANAGFCVPAGNCLGSGVLNVSSCKQGGVH